MKSGKPFHRPMAGTLLSISAPQVAEIISDSGFDWVLIDMEHSAFLSRVSRTLFRSWETKS